MVVRFWDLAGLLGSFQGLLRLVLCGLLLFCPFPIFILRLLRVAPSSFTHVPWWSKLILVSFLAFFARLLLLFLRFGLYLGSLFGERGL